MEVRLYTYTVSHTFVWWNSWLLEDTWQNSHLWEGFSQIPSHCLHFISFKIYGKFNPLPSLIFLKSFLSLLLSTLDNLITLIYFSSVALDKKCMGMKNCFLDWSDTNDFIDGKNLLSSPSHADVKISHISLLLNYLGSRQPLVTMSSLTSQFPKMTHCLRFFSLPTYLLFLPTPTNVFSITSAVFLWRFILGLSKWDHRTPTVSINPH